MMKNETFPLTDMSVRAVEAMIHAIARAIDDDRLEELPGFFTEAGTYKVASRFNLDRGLPMAQIYCTSRAMILDRMLSLRKANIYAKQHYRHLISGILVSAAPDGSLSARSNYMVVRTMEESGVSSIFSCGEYRDRIVFEEGVPKLSERTVAFDSRSIETLLAIPL
jgi:anthranilate 1,2-dioxygenase small subunit